MEKYNIKVWCNIMVVKIYFKFIVHKISYWGMEINTLSSMDKLLLSYLICILMNEMWHALWIITALNMIMAFLKSVTQPISKFAYTETNQQHKVVLIHNVQCYLARK